MTRMTYTFRTVQEAINALDSGTIIKACRKENGLYIVTVLFIY